MDPQLRKQLAQTVYVAARTGVDGYGKRTYGTAAERNARVIGHVEMIRDANGKEVVSAQQVILEALINITDKLWLPGEDPAVDPGRVPIAVMERVDENGATDHVKVFIGGFIR
jgi:hypothetical protein